MSLTRAADAIRRSLAHALAAAVGALLAATASAQPATITTVDAAGSVGRGSSVAGFDGFISYVDESNHRLKIAVCQDADCTLSTKHTVDPKTAVAGHTSAGRFMNYALVSYHDVANRDLKALFCGMPCDSSTAITVDGVGDVGSDSALAFRSDGRAVIAYTDATNQALKVAACGDAACSTAVITSYPGRGGRNPAIAIGSDGNPLIAADNGVDLFIGHCADSACTAATFLTLAGLPFPPSASLRYSQAALAAGGDGRGVVAYVVERGTHIGPDVTVHLARCVDVACSALSPVAATPQNFNFGPSVAVFGSDVPKVAYYSGESPYRLRVLDCVTAACNAPVVLDVDGPSAGRDACLRDVAGFPFVSYFDDTNADLKVAVLDGGPARPTDVSMTLTRDGVPTFTPGGPINYAFEVRNVSTTTAYDIRAEATWPAGLTAPIFPTVGPCTFVEPEITCTVPDLLPGGQWSYAFRATLLDPALTAVSLTMTASADGDVNASNDSSTVVSTVYPAVSLGDAAPVEGDSGITGAQVEVRLSRTATHPVTLEYATVAGGDATPGVDYLPASGTLTFPPGAVQRWIPVSVLGDDVIENNEGFIVRLTGGQGAGSLDGSTVVEIVDDDVNVASAAELAHGSLIQADLGGRRPGSDAYRMAQNFSESYEVIVDGVSGDVLPIGLQRVAADGSTVVQEAVATGTGTSRSLRWEHLTAVANQFIRVTSGGCTSGCGADDVYRIRAYETTLRGARFNNRGTQVTVVVLQNAGDVAASGQIVLWDTAGEPIQGEPFTVAPRGTAVVNTDALGGLAPDADGSLTVRHDAPYGVLRGKAVALEPATGLAFDTPLTARER